MLTNETAFEHTKDRYSDFLNTRITVHLRINSVETFSFHLKNFVVFKKFLYRNKDF